MKFLKNNKKLIVGIAIGVLATSGIGYATNTYLAGNIRYTKSGASSSISVDEALNELYTKVSTYKNLNTTTTATASDILNGKTAYDNLGNLITGNKTDNCISGSHIWTQEDSDNGLKLCDFTPSAFAITGVNKDNNYRYIFYYNNQISTSGLYLIRPIEEVIEFRSFNNMTSFVINDGLKLKWGTGWVGQQINYMVSR